MDVKLLMGTFDEWMMQIWPFQGPVVSASLLGGNRSYDAGFTDFMSLHQINLIPSRILRQREILITSWPFAVALTQCGFSQNSESFTQMSGYSDGAKSFYIPKLDFPAMSRCDVLQKHESGVYSAAPVGSEGTCPVLSVWVQRGCEALRTDGFTQGCFPPHQPTDSPSQEIWTSWEDSTNIY